jgi:hypothetical protein
MRGRSYWADREPPSLYQNARGLVEKGVSPLQCPLDGIMFLVRAGLLCSVLLYIDLYRIFSKIIL